MGEGRPIWPRSLCSAVMVTVGVLVACSHDPIESAPVYMMGADRATDRYAPVTLGSRPAVGQAGRRYPITPPASPAARTVQSERRSQHTVIAANHSTHSHEKAHAG